MQDAGNDPIGRDSSPVVVASEGARDFLNDPLLGARNLEVVAGGVVFEPDAAALNVYVVQSGQVRLYQVGPDSSARLVEILGPGQWFGIASLADPVTGPYGARAVAVTAAVIAEVPVDRFIDLLKKQPQQAVEWVRHLATKVESARSDAACLVFDDCNQRLVRALLSLSRSAAASPHAEGIVLRITHQQLAQAVGAARETISLALTQLRQQNVLRTGRNQLFFNPEVLEKLGRNCRVVQDEQAA